MSWVASAHLGLWQELQGPRIHHNSNMVEESLRHRNHYFARHLAQNCRILFRRLQKSTLQISRSFVCVACSINPARQLAVHLPQVDTSGNRDPCKHQNTEIPILVAFLKRARNFWKVRQQKSLCHKSKLGRRVTKHWCSRLSYV